MKKLLKSISVLIVVAIVLLMQLPTSVLATATNDMINSVKQNNTTNTDEAKYVEGEAIIMYNKKNYYANSNSNSIFSELKIEDSVEFKNANVDVATTSNTKISTNQDITISLVKSDKYSTDELVKILKENKQIMSVSKNYKFKATSVTNDPYEQYQWAIENNGQNGGTAGSDINPVKATDSEEKVIAIVDSGVDYTHEDLKNVMWNNPYSSKQLAGVHGYDFVNGDDDPMDDNGHGTHCAGIIAAEANNEEGTTGAVLGAKNVKIMALKISDEFGYCSNYEAIQAYNYIYRAQQLGTNVIAINNSWGGHLEEGDEDILTAVINLVGEKGALSICAAGNDGKNTDDYYNVPSCLDSEYIISVAASNEKDELATFSNYGTETVDIAAPGTDILSTVSYNVFNPTIYTDDQISNLCSVYDRFGDSSSELNVLEIEYENSEGTTVGLSSENNFGEKDGKSLKWNISDAQVGEIYYLAIPFNVESEEQYFSMMLKTEGIDFGGIFTLVQYDDDFDKLDLDAIDLPTDLWDILFSDLNYYWIGDFCTQNYWDHISGMANATGGTLLLQFIPYENGSYSFYIDDFAISNVEASEDDFGKYDFYNGTSMATPYVTAAVATTSNLYKGESALQTKSRILGGARQLLIENDDWSDVDWGDVTENNNGDEDWTETEDENRVIATNGTLDLTDLDNVAPEIRSASVDNDGKITVTGYFFGENPTLYINNEKVNAEYNSKTSTFTYTDKNLKNNEVLFSVSTIKDNITYVSEYYYAFLKIASNEFNNEAYNVEDMDSRSTIITTDGEDIYYLNENLELVKIDCDDGKNYTLADAKIFDLFDSYNSTMIGAEVYFQSMVYANNKIYVIAMIDCSFVKERILISYDLNKENAKWEKVSDVPDDMSGGNYTFTTYNSDLYIIGGYDADEIKGTKDVYIYETKNNAWKKGESLPEERQWSQAVQVGDKLVLMLGCNDAGLDEGKTANTLIFDGKQWKESNAYDFIKNNVYYGGGQISLAKDSVIVTGIYGKGIAEAIKYNVNTDSYENVDYIVSNDLDYSVTDAVSVKDKLYAVIYDWDNDKSSIKSRPIESGMVEVKANIQNNGATLTDNSNSEIKESKSYLPGTNVELNLKVKDGYWLNSFKVNGETLTENKYTSCLTSDLTVDVDTGKYVSSITLDKTSAELKIGNTLDLVATVDENATNKNLVWKSSDEKLATVSENGKVTAKGKGDVVITATSTDGSNVSAECKIKIMEQEPNSLISISKVSVTGIKDLTYTGQPLTQSLTVKNGSKRLNEGIDYVLRYSKNNNPGKATITITGIGDYTGTITRTFIITPKKVSGLKLSSANTTSLTLQWSKVAGADGYIVYKYNSSSKKYEYVGQTSKTSYTVKSLKTATTYKFKVRAYKTVDENKKFGAYSSILTTGTKTATPKISKVTASKKALTVKWGKVSGASGYEVYVATSKNGTYTKKATVTSGSTTSKKITGLKSKKTYYVKIRTYRTVDGKKIYSSYSSVKSIKVK